MHDGNTAPYPAAKSHFCQWCSRSFPSAKSVSGHMRACLSKPRPQSSARSDAAQPDERVSNEVPQASGNSGADSKVDQVDDTKLNEDGDADADAVSDADDDNSDDGKERLCKVCICLQTILNPSTTSHQCTWWTKLLLTTKPHLERWSTSSNGMGTQQMTILGSPRRTY